MTTKICPICKKRVDILRSAVKGGAYVSERCDSCLASFGGFADGARAFARNWDKREHARSLVQPFEPEFIKAYGADKAREKGWNDDAIRRYS